MVWAYQDVTGTLRNKFFNDGNRPLSTTNEVFEARVVASKNRLRREFTLIIEIKEGLVRLVVWKQCGRDIYDPRSALELDSCT